jgi:antirestriction protein ArdC
MSKYKRPNNYESPKQDIYEMITNEVIKKMEGGEIIWRQPWVAATVPQNAVTGYRYRGWNPFLLNMVCVVKGYKRPYFLTYLQAQEQGGHIRAKETGIRIVKWLPYEDTTRTIRGIDPQTGAETFKHPQRMAPKCHTVFNIEQTEGVELPLTMESIVRTEVEKIAACDALIAGMPDAPQIFHEGNEAFYLPSTDSIYMPRQQQFFTDHSYYATLFHELSHATGHTSRLNRSELMDPNARFGTTIYSKEELTAELSASYLCGVTGIEKDIIDNSAAYIRGWMQKLKQDKKLLLNAANLAQASADFIQNISKQSPADSAALVAAAA